VCGPLQTYLKKNQGFKLGLHERDFEAGKYNADNIIDAINTSRKIIFVISSSFLRRCIPLVTRQQHCKDTVYLLATLLKITTSVRTNEKVTHKISHN
jgi:hypothetical protein